MAEDLLAVADELYGLPLADFTPARDARAKELRESADLARAVKALRKPSLAAWVVDLLVRRDPDQVAQVLAVGAALREAQAAMSGDDLRALTRQRRQLTAAVTQRARALAGEEGVRVTPSVADQVEATLTAAMLDPRCAEAVRSGLLVSALSATGVDEVDVHAAVALPDALGFTAAPRPAAGPATGPAPTGRPDLRVVPDPEADAKALAAARDALEEAEGDVRRAQEEYDEALAAQSELEARSMQLQAEIDELRRRLAELEERADEVDDEIAEAEDGRGAAHAELSAATTVRDAAVAEVARREAAGS